MSTQTLRRAPAGFTREQWEIFERDGFLQIPDAMTPDEVDHYLQAARECTQSGPVWDPAHTYKVHNLVTQHHTFRELIDHDRHVGFAYDIFGDQLRLVHSDLLIRPRQGVINQWHFDGPRVVPYRAFSPVLPLKLRIGYWLTDLPEPGMGNLVYLPGSHRADYDAEHAGIGDVPGQRALQCKAGTITIAHASTWHRVDGNLSDTTRVTIFLSYAPSWVTGYYSSDEQWLNTLSREQRIIMRPYDSDKEQFTRPPAEDLPLFADEQSLEHSPEKEFHKIRRRSRYERQFRSLP
jgi:hypothetical protein